MNFLWPDLLWLLVLVPALIALYIWLLSLRKRSSLRYANLPLLRQAVSRNLTWRRHVPPALLLLAITLLIVAVARPVAMVELASSRSTVILSMDVSGSMRATDMPPSRLGAAQEAAKAFIAQQPVDVEIGIVAFASAAMLMQAPTLDRDQLNATINSFDLRRGTAVGAGIIAALATIFPDEDFDMENAEDPRDRLGLPSSAGRSLDDAEPEEPEREPAEPGSFHSAVVILLTDGATTTGPDPVLAARLAASYGVRVHTVGFGSTDGDVVDFGGRSMRAMLDAPTLQTIADLTLGEYFEAKSSEALTEVYETLSKRLVPERKLTEIAFILAGVAALVSIAAASLSVLWFGRIT